jgi:hypothetical protein
VAALALVVACALPSTAEAYRRGLGSALGGATLGRGHSLWLLAGFPTTAVGWTVAVHPRVDLTVLGQVAYGDPARLGEPLVGGGGGGRARFALARGRLSVAAVVDLGAVAYSESHGSAALVDILSPTLALSMRLGDRVALHANVRAVLQLVTAPAELIGGVEAGLGATVGLTRGLALLVSASYGTSISAPYGPGAGRLAALVGLEYRLGAEPRPTSAGVTSPREP